jgi:hypothetical protein
MGTVASYPARTLKLRRRAWLRHRASVVAVIVGGVLVMAALVTMMLWVLPGSMPWYVLGLAHAGIAAAGLHLLNSAFLAFDPQAMSYVRGAWGEDNTRTELERAKRKRLVWDWVDSIELQVGDIDHLVVTRHGGVVAIDSKWRNQITANDVSAMADSARRAGLRAEGLLGTLLKAERRSRHRARTRPLSVTPVVVLWGTARSEVPADATVSGVRFLDGRQLLTWLAELDGHDVPRDAANAAVAQLRRYRSTAAVSTSISELTTTDFPSRRRPIDEP